jgi:predicted membrane protein
LAADDRRPAEAIPGITGEFIPRKREWWKRVSDEPKIETGRHNWRGTSGWVPGALLIVIGTLFLLDHMNVIQGEKFWRYWPLLLVAVGIAKFVNEGKRVGGTLLILMGGFLMAERLGYTTLTWGSIWPVLIIAAGVMMIWGRFDLPQLRPAVASDGRDTIQALALFGGVERRITVKNFRRGAVQAILGGVELDFRGADIEGEEAILTVEAVFGGIEITVPEQWQVIFEGESIFGGYTDETRTPAADPLGATPKKFLILRGRAVFGGISVQN